MPSACRRCSLAACSCQQATGVGSVWSAAIIVTFTEITLDTKRQRTAASASSSPSSAFCPHCYASLSLVLLSLFFHSVPSRPPFSSASTSPLFTHRWNSVLSAACIMATMVLVTDVPMLEPMMMGTADLTSSTAR